MMAALFLCGHYFLCCIAEVWVKSGFIVKEVNDVIHSVVLFWHINHNVVE